MRYFEDFEPGDRHEIGSHVVSRDEIIRFAKEWDPRPFHVDEALAQESVFGGLTASSCHIYAVSARITAESDADVAAAAMLGVELKVPRPVRPGDALTLITSCIEKRLSESRPGLGLVRTRSTLENQRGEVALEMISTFLIRCRPAA